MALEFAYSLDGDAPSTIRDYQAAITGDTIAAATNPQNPAANANAAGAYTPVKGHLVALNDQGRIVQSKITTGAYAPASTFGVCEGPNFQGLAIGGQYAAANAMTGTNSQKNTLAKVRIDPEAVYRVPLKAGSAAPLIGWTYGIDVVNGDAQLNVSSTGTAMARVIDFDAAKSVVFVNLTSRIAFI